MSMYDLSGAIEIFLAISGARNRQKKDQFLEPENDNFQRFLAIPIFFVFHCFSSIFEFIQ